MAICPRCSLSVAAYTRCDRCGLMLGFEGLTVLLEFEESPHFERARKLARKQPSFSEWLEESGGRFLRVTYAHHEMEDFREFARTAGRVRGKKVFLNGLEIPWKEAGETGLASDEEPARQRKSGLRDANLTIH